MKKILKRVGSALLSFAVSLQIFTGTIGEGLSLMAFADSGTVTFDISQGSVNITDSTYSGYDSSGTNISGSSSGVNFVITGTTTTNTVTVSGTQDITLSNCSVDVSSTGSGINDPGSAAFCIVDDNTGNVNVTLVGENILKSGYNRAGLEKNGDTSTGTLTISGTGKLTTVGGIYGAGIGGGYNGDGSNIAINGGTVTATGDGIRNTSGGAGIGGGRGGNGSNITISGGTVTARSSCMGAGIGGGSYGNGSYITISNGIVKATAGANGAGIGGGWSGSGSGITINGGTVTATASDGGAGIGSGNRGSNGSDILITGGVINATGGKNAAGIGAGGGGDQNPTAFGGFSNIRITGGIIYAKGGTWVDIDGSYESHGAAGIGGSYMGNQVFGISIEGGTVTAVGAANAAGIGGGDTGNCNNVTITGGSVKATAGSGCNNNIGSGRNSTVVTSITNGTSVIYLLTLANPNSADVMIDDVSYTPVNHAAADSSDKNLYVYLTGETHTISCNNITRTYVYSTSLSKWLVSPISSFSSTSVTKTFGDAAFSAGFTTDSDGMISYSSSNTSVATVATNGTITIKGAGSTTITASTPETSSYTEDSKTMTLTVNKKGSYITGVTASGITYGQTLNASVLNHTDGISGTLTWSAPNTKPNAGAQNYEWIFTPTDTTNYAVVTCTTSVSVAKADPTITASPTQGITYGQKLSETGISGSATGVDGANINGTWAYQTPNAKPQVSDSGRTQYTIVFTPSDANYNSKTITTTVQVSPATLTIADVNVSTTPITYGQTLSASNITATCSKVSGTIAWSAPNTKPSVTDSGVIPYVARFTPSSSNYRALDLTATVVVNKASTNITVDIQNSLSASDITYGQTLGDSTISGDKPAPGYYTWANPDIAPTVANSNITEYDVIFIPTDETNYNRSTTKLKLKVNPATLVLTPEIKASITASQITYGDTLVNSTLSGTTPIGVDGQNVVGQYVWVDNTIAPEVADSDRTKYDVVFKPTDSLNYTEVSGLQATVTVIKATPVITPEMEATISATAITYNQTLADSQLSGNTPIPGHYEWVDDTIAPSVADSGVIEYDVRFIPNDTANNNTVDGITCKLIVNKATPDVNSSVLATISASDITYGDSLVDSSITGDLPVNSKGDEVVGSYAWADSSIKPSVSDSELNPYTVIFTPADTDNYITATFTLTLKVNKADITIPGNIEATITASDIVYEQSLGDSTLSGTMPDVNGTPITGHYEWADSSIQPGVAASGVTVYEVVFKPDDSINYNDVTGLYTTLIITKLTPSIEPDVIATLSASGITYGQTLGDSTILGNTPRPGHWEWVDESVMPIVADSNSRDFAINWIPDDADNYNIASTMLSLGVSKATPAVDISMLTIGGIVWGTRLGDASLTGDYPTLNGSDITGNYSWINPDDILDAGDQSAQVLFTPTDLNNFNTASIGVTVHVNPLVPTFTPEITSSIHASDITYGQTLASAILSGDVPVAGHYEWKSPDTLPTVADSNTMAYEVVFIPDDGNYANAEFTCTLAVSKKAFTFTQSEIDNLSVSDLTYGQTLSQSTISGNTPVAGSYRWADGAIVPTVTNITGYEVEFVPNDTNNYEIVTAGNVRVSVSKANPVVTDEQLAAIVATPITYGQTLASSTVTGTASVAGSFKWADTTIAPSVSDSEFTKYDLTFTPADTDNYNSITVKSIIKVNKAPVVISDEIKQSITATDIIYGDALADSDLSGATPVEGSYRWANASVVPVVNAANNFAVEFVPTDINNYEIVSAGDVHVTVNKAEPVVTQEQIDAVTTSVLIYGQTLGNSTLTGTSTTPGTYGWTNPDIIPSIADSETTLYEVTFTPNDTDNYNTKVFNKTVVVINADIEIPDNILQSITAAGITYEQTLGDSVITGDVPMSGHYEWANPDIVPTVADSNSTEYDILFVPDNIYYNNVELKLKLIVSKKTHVFSVDDIAQLSTGTLIYGQTLADIDITGPTPVAGEYQWVDGSIVPTVDGSNNFAVRFVPTDLDNYEIASVGDVHVNVNQADSIITAEQLAAISVTELTYGQSLADSIITATASIPGSFDWEDSSIVPTVADSLSTSYTIVFTPTDNINYSAKRINATVKVNKAATTLTDAIKQSVSASAITYGESLVDSSISGDTPRDGHYEWKDSSIQPSVADSNATSYDVVFVPDDGNYAVAEMPLKLVVNKKALVFSADELSNISASDLFYGQSLANSVLSGATPVSGSYRWADDSIVPTVNGANDFEVEFVPIDTDNYEIVTAGDIHVTVNAADFVLSSEQLASISASAITYGQSLADSTISASDTIPGVFEWEDGSIAPSVADSLSTEYAVVFTPNDTVNYKQGTHMLKVKVNQAVPEVPDDIETSISIPNLTYGQSLDDLTITYTGSAPFPGHFEWVDPSMSPSVSDSGATEYEIKYVPDDPNYKPIIYKVKVQVDKAPPPQEYDNMSKDIAVPPGANGSIDLSTILDDSWEVVDIQIDDPNRIFDGEPAIIDGKLVFNYNQEKSFVNETGTIKLTIKSPNYEDFDIELNIKATSCKHVNGTTNVGRYASTCTSQGYTGDIVCDTCHCVVKVGRFLPVSAHRCTTKNHTPATCTSEGYSGDEYCKDCGELVSSGHILEMTEHTEGEPVTVVEPTYAAEGKYDYYCIDCNAFIRSSVIPKLSLEGHEHVWESGYGHDEHDHWKECTECHNSFDKEAHHYDDGTYITATCTIEGRVEYTCGVCGLTVLRIEVPGHKPVWKYDENGDRHFKQCKECGKVFETENHNYGQWIEVVTPTDTELGTYVHTCNECGYIETVHSATNPEVGSDIGGSEGGNGGNSTGGNSSDPTGGSGSNSGNNASSIGDNGTNTGKGENPDTGIEFDVIKFVALALVSAATILLSRKCKI